MEEINKNNYQAWFLDYIEGNLGEKESSGLFAFLSDHPDLMEEFEQLQSLENEDLKLAVADNTSSDWTELKNIPFQTLLEEEESRDNLYFRITEGIAEEGDDDLLIKLIDHSPAFLKEYESWKRLNLIPAGHVFANKEELHKSRMGEPVNENNFEEYCIALIEGLLNEDQQGELISFAAKDPQKQKVLQEYKSTRLLPEKGIFYPDKEKLYRKEKRVALLPLFRVAVAVAAIFILMFLWFTPEEASNAVKIADKPGTVTSDEAANTTEPKEENASNEPVLAEMDTVPAKPLEKVNLENKTKNGGSSPSEKAVEKVKKSVPEVEENIAGIEAIEPDIEPVITLPEDLQVEPQTLDDMNGSLADALDINSSETVQYQKINEFAQQQLTQLLIGNPATSENSNENLLDKVKKVAEDVTGTRVDYKTVKPLEEEEYLSYSIRIGGIKVSRSSSR